MKKLILILILIFTVSSCRNGNSNDCQTWKVEEYCVPKNSSTYCGMHTTNTKPICGDDLKSASAGNTVLIREDANVKYYRKYIQKI